MRTFIIAIFISFSWQIFAHELNCPTNVNTCDTYDCAEDVFRCGKRGYLKNFGKKYCNYFLEKHNHKKISPRLRKWLAGVRLCLQEELNKISTHSSCKQVKKRSVNSHYGCYLKSGYCSLKEKDKITLFYMLRSAILTSYSPQMFIQLLKIINHCR